MEFNEIMDNWASLQGIFAFTTNLEPCNSYLARLEFPGPGRQVKNEP